MKVVAKTSPSTSTASGASLLASFLLLHSVLPRIRSLSMENTENAVRCLDFLAARRAPRSACSLCSPPSLQK